MTQTGPCGQPRQSASCRQRVAHVPSTHWSFANEQSVSIVHSDLRRQSGWQMPRSQKSAGFAQSVLALQFVWQVALMQVKPAPQSWLKRQVSGGVGVLKQKPPWQGSPVPHSPSLVQGLWHMPPPSGLGTHLPPARSASRAQVSAAGGIDSVLHAPSQQLSPAAQSASDLQPVCGGACAGWQVWRPVSHTMPSDEQSLSLLQVAVSMQLP